MELKFLQLTLHQSFLHNQKQNQQNLSMFKVQLKQVNQYSKVEQLWLMVKRKLLKSTIQYQLNW